VLGLPGQIGLGNPNTTGVCITRLRPCRASDLAVDLARDEVLDGLLGFVVGVLHGRALHEVGARRQDRATDAAVLGDLRGT
jgi:hypothetical protein